MLNLIVPDLSDILLLVEILAFLLRLDISIILNKILINYAKSKEKLMKIIEGNLALKGDEKICPSVSWGGI